MSATFNVGDVVIVKRMDGKPSYEARIERVKTLDIGTLLSFKLPDGTFKSGYLGKTVTVEKAQAPLGWNFAPA